jgi:hypothetical protein
VEVTAAIKIVQGALIQRGQVPWLEWGSELLPNLMQRLADESEESIEDLEADFSRRKGDIDDRYLEEDWTDEARTSALANLENEFVERRAQAEERRVRKLRNGWYGRATRAREERAQSVGEKETGERTQTAVGPSSVIDVDVVLPAATLDVEGADEEAGEKKKGSKSAPVVLREVTGKVSGNVSITIFS